MPIKSYEDKLAKYIDLYVEKKLNNTNYPHHIIHNNMDEFLGVDFKLKGDIHINFVFNPKNYFVIAQALLRGSRDFDKFLRVLRLLKIEY